MKKYILKYICSLEGRKSEIKQIHWAADNLSQHELCDKIADALAEYQDKVSEVEQSISGKFKIGDLKAITHQITNVRKFVQDLLDEVNEFHKKLEKEGDTYKGMRSDTEAFLSQLQTFLYLAEFTMKESLKERLRNKINENRVTISDGKHEYSLTENELRELVAESVKNVKSKLDEHYFDKNMALHELQLYTQSLRDFSKKTNKVASLMMETGYKQACYYLADINRDCDRALEYIERGDIPNEYDTNK